jgi:hypothetical protein
MMVIFLTGLVSMILMRTLRADYARYTARDDDDLEALERDVGEESGSASLSPYNWVSAQPVLCWPACGNIKPAKSLRGHMAMP